MSGTLWRLPDEDEFKWRATSPLRVIGRGRRGYIGYLSGRTDMRNMMTPEQIQHNCDCFKKQMSRFIDFSDGKALMVNNADWLLNLNYIELRSRNVGACFSVNNTGFSCRML